ncbi:MAG: hypothetical protein JXR84_07235 [Anaerolineae bacterium]|nr:hypothetical protein [Anaerolineae bacterium]
MLKNRFYRWGAITLVIVLALGLRLYNFEPPHTNVQTALQQGYLPPGLHYDEAYNLLAALRVWRTGKIEPFIRIDMGRMPMHINLTALLFAWVGPITVGGRLTALLAGLANIAAVGLLAIVVFRRALPDTERGLLACLVAGQMAVTYWHVHFSRLGMEHTQLTLFSTLAMLALWWVVHKPALWRALLAGLILGVAVYTYPAAYFLPVSVALIGLSARKSVVGPRVRLTLGYAFGFALAILPLTLFFVQFPEWLTSRPGAVAITTLSGFWDNVCNTVGGLFWQGDSNVSYNLPGRPFFDILQTTLFAIGLIVCLRRWREPAYLFGPIWLGVMLLPQILSQAPHFGRLSGATVPALLIVAVGELAVSRFIQRRSESNALTLLTLIGIMLISAGWTARDYFVRWPKTGDLLRTFRVAERLEAELALQAPSTAYRFISPVDRTLSTIDFVLGDQAEDYVKSFNGRKCTVLPAEGQPAYYWLTAYEDTQTAARLERLYGTSLRSRSFAVQQDELVRQIELLPEASLQLPPASQCAPDQTFGNLMQPLAVLLPDTPCYTDDAKLSVTIVWRLLGTTLENKTLGLYLLSPDFPASEWPLVSQTDAQPCDRSYPTSVWSEGERLVEDYQLSLPSDLVPGTYTLAAALYQLESGERQPVLDGKGPIVGDLMSLATIEFAQR